ncbi:MAG: antitermination protein NusB, partial [Odoribacter sp.]|nr:antitermination protein NusB [Odoribacter sp.]
MTSRRLIRIKVLQLLYAFSKKESATLAEIERELMQSVSKSTDLYYETLLLITEIRHKAFLKIDAARNRRLTSASDLNPNVRFITNPIFDIIEKNKKFQSYIHNNLISWNDMQETIVYFYNKLLEWPAYQKYMNRKDVSFETHKQLVLDMFSELIIQDDIFFQNLEDKNIFWNDDFELVLSIVYKTLWHIKSETTADDDILYPIYKSGEDTEFARTLIRKAFNDYDQNIRIIDKFTYNWELDRISDIDKLIMVCAISELKHFPSIPIKVTLDEYIEISKTYSSPKSGAFINGIL